MQENISSIERDALISKRMENDIEYLKKVLDAYCVCQTLQISSTAEYYEYSEYITGLKEVSYFEVTHFKRMTNDEYAQSVTNLANITDTVKNKTYKKEKKLF